MTTQTKGPESNRPPCPDWPSGRFIQPDGTVGWNCVKRWEWSVDHARWGAWVYTHSGEDLFTYPVDANKR